MMKHVSIILKYVCSFMALIAIAVHQVIVKKVSSVPKAKSCCGDKKSYWI
jgi:hypothetical protein